MVEGFSASCSIPGQVVLSAAQALTTQHTLSFSATEQQTNQYSFSFSTTLNLISKILKYCNASEWVRVELYIKSKTQLKSDNLILHWLS